MKWCAWWRVGLGLGLAVILLMGCAKTPDNPGGGIISRDADPMGFSGGTSLDQPYTMPDTVLDDTSGHDFNLRTSPSTKATLVFFGYTNCPDVCLTVMADVAQALRRMDAGDRQQIQLLFITTDPARDNGPVLRAYLDRFDPQFIGLTGQLATIKQTAGQLGVDISGMKRLPSGGYEVGHSAQVIGFTAGAAGGREGVVIWTPSTSIGDLKHDFSRLVHAS